VIAAANGSTTSTTGPYAAAFIDHRLTVPAGKVALLH
jgi:hypothetical protein